MKLRTLQLVIVFALFSLSTAFSQQSIGGEPFSYKGKIASLDDDHSIYSINLPAFDMEAIRIEDSINDLNGRMQFISRFHDVSVNLSNSGTWTTLSNGSKIWKLRINASGAKGLGLIFDQFHMPEGARMYIYNGNRSHHIGAFTSLNNKSWNGFSTGVIPGESTIIEYFEPAAVAGQGVISIEKVSHAYRNVPNSQDNAMPGDPCEVSTACSPEADNWQDQKQGVVRILVSSGGGQGWCSGSLINNTDLDCKPYILTALHCGDNSTTNNFNNYIFYFNYETANCNGGSAPTNMSVTGCTKRAESNDGGGTSGSDFLLVEISGATVTQTLQGWNAYWNGWNSSNTASPSGVSIHHPAGDSKCISTYSSSLTTTQWGSGTGSHWLVDWVGTANGHGVTEGGSSGSPIFNSTGHIVGQLTGGSSYCTQVPNTSPDLYGKMSYNWTSNPGDDLKDWLDPGNTGATSLNGTYFPCTPSSPLDAGINAIDEPTGTLCGAAFVPEVELKNYGTSTLTSVTINYDVDGVGSQTYNWTGSLATNSTTIVTLPAMSTTNGAHTFNASTSSPNGGTDGNTANDASAEPFTVVIGGSPVTLTLVTDCWGSETTWEIQDNGTTLYSGGPYTDVTGGETFVENFCLADACYDFIINDTYGDGMYGSQYGSCSVDGTYSIVDDNTGSTLATILATNSDFGNQEVNNFCVASVLLSSFSGTPTTVCVGNSVSFSDLSSGNPTSWSWTFQNGTPPNSTAQNPTVSYATPGVFDVTLTVNDGSSTDSYTQNGYITVVSAPSPGVDVQTACNSYTWIDGNTYTSDNNSATYTVQNAAGCDSTVTLDLTIINVDNTVTQNGTVLTADQSGATYQWVDCDNNNAAISGATSQSFTPTTTGNYAVVVTLNGCTVTSSCNLVEFAGIVENDFEGLVVSPNPTSGKITVTFGQVHTELSVKLYAVNGQLIKTIVVENDDHFDLNIEGSIGYYFVEILSDDNKRASIKVLKK